MIEGDAKKAVLKLFQCFNVNGSDSERKIKFTAYWEVLRSLPAEIVISVCGKAARGEVGARGFLPSSAELYQAATWLMPRKSTPLLEEPIFAEEREHVSMLIRELADGMKMQCDKKYESYAPPHVDIEAFLAAKYRDKPMPKLSSELRAKLGAGIPRIEE
jgi:hypothetical protein